VIGIQPLFASATDPRIEVQDMSDPLFIAAVDLDTRACGVIAHAAKIAALCQGRLMVVHVVDYPGGYEPDQPSSQPHGAVLRDMVRHARASLMGMILHLDLPTDWIEIQVQTGPTVETLAALAGAYHPRYVLIGRARWGILSCTADLDAALAAGNGGKVLAVSSA
jgi:hypothetical protein